MAQTVVVEWFIRPGRKAAAAFAGYRKPIPENTPGFQGERLYRAKLDGVEPAVVYVNIGEWRSQDDFFAFFPKARRDRLPDKERFESRQRRRYWLTPESAA